MKATVVRYQTRPDQAEENQRLVEAVFADLEKREPVATGATVVGGYR